MRLIDADMALELKDKDMNLVYDLTDLDQFLAGVPTAEAELVRHGKWEECFEDWRQQISGNKCSLCGFIYFGDVFKYCPHCGAKMDLND